VGVRAMFLNTKQQNSNKLLSFAVCSVRVRCHLDHGRFGTTAILLEFRKLEWSE